MSIMDRLGWNKSQQEQIKHIVRNTKDSMKPLVAGMRVGTGFREDEKFIVIFDRTGLTAHAAFTSKSFDDRDKLFEIYRKLIKELGLPYCCSEHRREAEGDFNFDDDDFEFVAPDDDGFDFADDDGFDFS